MKRMLLFFGAWCALAAFSVIPAVKAQESKLPPGPGKALVERTCTKCHSLSEVVEAHSTRERWESVVDDMVSRGAEGTDDELNTIVDYLAANFGAKPKAPKTNVNKASTKELADALGISEPNSEAIVAYRQKNGDFKDWDSLSKVPDIDLKKLEAHKGSIEY